MKYFINITLIIMLAACNHVSEKAVIRGTIHHPNADFLLLISQTGIDTITIDISGNFHMEKFIENPGYFKIADGKEKFTVFIDNGCELFILIDNRESPREIQFSGIGEFANKYLWNSSQISMDIKSNERELNSLTESTFMQFTDSIRSYKNSLLSAIETDSQFYKLEKARIFFEWALRRIRYPSSHSYHTNNEDFEVSEGFFDFLEEIPTGESEYMVLPEYEDLINIMVRQDAYITFQNDDSYDIEHGYFYAKLNAIDSIITNNDIKNEMAGQTVLSLLKRNGPDGLDSLLNIYYSVFCNNNKSDEVEGIIEKWNIISTGSKAPDFTNCDSSGREYSLSDFRGNYVYIDVWASWCHPCVSKLESMKRLVNEYKGKNIVFLSVSVDTDNNEWKDMIIDKELNWLQLISDDGWNTGIVDDYLIKTIPRYILIDPDGNIISAKAPGPDVVAEEVFSRLGFRDVVVRNGKSLTNSYPKRKNFRDFFQVTLSANVIKLSSII